MDVYILDEFLRRSEVVEHFESMIWTERFKEYGDFELVISPALADKVLTTKGTCLAIDLSDRVMVVDTSEATDDDDGVRKLKITGRSLEYIFESRPNQNSFHTGAAAGTVVLTDTPGNIIRTLFNAICRLNPNITTDNLPGVQVGTISSFVGAIPEPVDIITLRSEIDTLYNTIKTVADMYNLGFRLIRVADDSKLYFEVYAGFDRTTGQTALAPVVFSAALDNLTDTTEFESTVALKNVAYVFAPNGSRIVYADGVDPTVSGFEKKSLIVNASDITLAAGASLDAALDQRGKEELAKYRIVIAFDGEILQTAYIYGTHYMLGDIVEKRSDSGISTYMRVSEQIFVSDSAGERSYPTLTLDTLITPGSWDAQIATKQWDDFTTETWDSM